MKVIINGGGLGGLGVAIALKKKGHQVTVLEAAPELSEVGAGIQIPPNSSRILCSYGLKDKFLSEKYGSPYWLIHRADFQGLLFDAAKELGVDIRLGCYVESVNVQDPSVKLANGEILTADLVVGADGIRSKTREALLGRIVEPNPAANCSYRATVPVEIMSADPDISHLMTDINANCWIGPNHHIMAYPIRQGAMYNLVLSHPSGLATPGKWNEPGNLEEMRQHYKDFDPIIQKVLSKVQSCLNWKIADLPNLRTWVSENGRVVLLGDAAHAMVPFLAQGAAQAIEDGACLAECLARSKDPSGIPALMRAYEAIRKPRAERVQQATRDSSRVWHLHDGPEQEARDLAFASMAANARDEKMDEALEKANPNSLSGREFQPWLFGHDEIALTNARLDEMFKLKK